MICSPSWLLCKTSWKVDSQTKAFLVWQLQSFMSRSAKTSTTLALTCIRRCSRLHLSADLASLGFAIRLANLLCHDPHAVGTVLLGAAFS